MIVLYAVILVRTLAIGWVAGMLTFRRASSWCTQCGETLGCLRCARRS